MNQSKEDLGKFSDDPDKYIEYRLARSFTSPGIMSC
jgi:hypothetical protein